MRKVTYVPKPKTVKDFGCGTDKELKTWVPEICGVCCLKMVGDTRNETNNTSLWRLTQDCIEEGAFIQSPGDGIEGIFYKPLLRCAR